MMPGWIGDGDGGGARGEGWMEKTNLYSSHESIGVGRHRREHVLHDRPGVIADVGARVDVLEEREAIVDDAQRACAVDLRDGVVQELGGTERA